MQPEFHFDPVDYEDDDNWDDPDRVVPEKREHAKEDSEAEHFWDLDKEYMTPMKTEHHVD